MFITWEPSSTCSSQFIWHCSVGVVAPTNIWISVAPGLPLQMAEKAKSRVKFSFFYFFMVILVICWPLFVQRMISTGGLFFFFLLYCTFDYMLETFFLCFFFLKSSRCNITRNCTGQSQWKSWSDINYNERSVWDGADKDTHTHTRIILLIKEATIAWPPHREAHTPRARVQIISRRTGPPSPPPTVLPSPSRPLPLLVSRPSCLSVLLEVQGSFVDFSGAAIWPQRGAEASKILLWWL